MEPTTESGEDVVKGRNEFSLFEPFPSAGYSSMIRSAGRLAFVPPFMPSTVFVTSRATLPLSWSLKCQGDGCWSREVMLDSRLQPEMGDSVIDSSSERAVSVRSFISAARSLY